MDAARFRALDARIVLVAFVFWLQSATAADGPFTNLGEGLSSCGDWLDKRYKTPSRVIPEAAWVLGFLTAASQIT
jgi:hypothetical protein